MTTTSSNSQKELSLRNEVTKQSEKRIALLRYARNDNYFL